MTQSPTGEDFYSASCLIKEERKLSGTLSSSPSFPLLLFSLLLYLLQFLHIFHLSYCFVFFLFSVFLVCLLPLHYLLYSIFFILESFPSSSLYCSFDPLSLSDCGQHSLQEIMYESMQWVITQNISTFLKNLWLQSVNKCYKQRHFSSCVSTAANITVC